MVRSPKSCAGIRLSMQQLEDRLAPAVFKVTNAANAGAGSLRYAIVRANASPGLDSINFAIPGSGLHTINLLSALPTVTDRVTIAGNTQVGYAGKPIVELNGGYAPARDEWVDDQRSCVHCPGAGHQSIWRRRHPHRRRTAAPSPAATSGPT